MFPYIQNMKYTLLVPQELLRQFLDRMKMSHDYLDLYKGMKCTRSDNCMNSYIKF